MRKLLLMVAVAATCCNRPAAATAPFEGLELQWQFQVRNKHDDRDIPPRFFHAMANLDYTDGNSSVVLFGGLHLNNTDAIWTDPSKCAKVYDDTWLWRSSTTDAGTWVQVSVDGRSSPAPRFAHAMAHLDRGKVMLFGGQANTTSSSLDEPVHVLQDVWIFSPDAGGSWEHLPRQNASDGGKAWPSNRSFATLSKCGDPNYFSQPEAGKMFQVLMFGGRGSHHETLVEETWVFKMWYNENGDSDSRYRYEWEHITGAAPGKHPSARWGHAMAPMGSQDVVLFGGQRTSNTLLDNPTKLDDTWVFQCPTNATIWHDSHRIEDSWTRIDVETSQDLTSFLTLEEKPSARAHHSMAKAAGETVIMFGGGGNKYVDGSSTFEKGSTWFFTKSTTDGDVSKRYKWRKLPGYGPARRYGGSLATIVRSWVGGLVDRPDDVLLFGGRIQRNISRFIEDTDGSDTW